MGTRTMIEAALSDGRMTHEEIRSDYERLRVKGKMPPDMALRQALGIRSNGALATFKRFAYENVDTNGKPLTKARRKTFQAIVDTVREVEDKMLDDWKETADRMKTYDPFRYGKAMHPEIMAGASDGAMSAEVMAALERALVAVQSRISQEADQMAIGALARLSNEVDEDRRREILRTLVIESFQAALAGGQYFEV